MADKPMQFPEHTPPPPGAVNLEPKKSDYLSATVAFAERLLALTREGEELAAYGTANQFQSGGTNAIVDADAVGGNSHLDAATVNAVVTIAGQLGGAVTVTMRNTLRRASLKPIP